MTDVLGPGQLFARRYRIEKFLASGGFGAVYVAEQIETELRVAIKVLWPQVLGSPEAIERFKLEARIAGRVGSEHIVRVFDAGFDEETRMPFLVMELLQGTELDRLVAQSGPLPPEQLIAYFRQIASALDKAHGYVDRDGRPSPIVHRDLKPENLFLATRETGEPWVKVLDFGIAKVLSTSAVSQQLMGTPVYMAYEQVAGGRISPGTDIWALGLIAFFLHTGRSYWKSANLEEPSMAQLFGEVLSQPLVAPSERARELEAKVVPSALFDDWFSRCVNRDPGQRFTSAGEAAEALAGVFGDVNTRRRGGVVAESAGPSQQRNVTATFNLPLDALSEAVGPRPRSLATTGGVSALSRTNPAVGPRGRGVAAVVVIGGVLAGAGIWGAMRGASGRDASEAQAPASSGVSSGGAKPGASPTVPPQAATPVPIPSAAPSAAVSAPASASLVRRPPTRPRSLPTESPYDDR